MDKASKSFELLKVLEIWFKRGNHMGKSTRNKYVNNSASWKTPDFIDICNHFFLNKKICKKEVQLSI